jgi:hypothetical protein
MPKPFTSGEQPGLDSDVPYLSLNLVTKEIRLVRLFPAQDPSFPSALSAVVIGHMIGLKGSYKEYSVV